MTIKVFNRLDIVINNAGVMNDRFWELEVDVNLVNIKFFPNKYMFYIYRYLIVKAVTQRSVVSSISTRGNAFI